MAFVKLLKVYQALQPYPSLLLEQKNNNEFLWINEKCTVTLNSTDGNHLKHSATKLCDAYGCLGAVYLNKGSETLGYYLVLVNGCKSVGRILDSDIYRITDVQFVSMNFGTFESSNTTVNEMKRLLCSGSFYFFSTFDNNRNSSFITQSLQSSAKEEREEYLWNRNLISYFSIQGVSCRSWFLYIMCGGVDIRTFYAGAQQGKVAVINRLSCERVGTRYNVRGVDDYGNVANFVESEQIVNIGSSYSSFIIIRGSVPLFWEQPGLNVGSHKVKIPYYFDVSFQAFERHIDHVKSSYSKCTIVNLLGSKEGESTLSHWFQQHHETSQYKAEIPFINFDYHTECRAGKPANISKLMEQLNPVLSEYGVMHSHQKRIKQNGVLRVNCLDCLDRTNSVQTYVGLQMVSEQLKALGHSDNTLLLTRVTDPLKAIWQQTGDLISRMYAGTGALEGKDAVGKLKDGAKSLSRSIQNNFLDQGKQETMNMLLRIPAQSVELYHLSRTLLTQKQLRKSSPVLQKNMFKRKLQFCDEFPMRIVVGTWNVNGGKHFRSIAYKDKTLKDWLMLKEPNAPAKSYYQAIYEYTSAEEGDLNFSINDIIVVDSSLQDGDWLHGYNHDSEGIFPAAYAQHIEDPHLVLHDFPAQENGDLELWTNEIVDVLERNDDWFVGKVYRNGSPEEGTFPANFVEKVQADEKVQVDVYAIGFEEMVELNAGNIVSASQANQQAWAVELQKTLSENEEYVLITSEQLVGVCLFVFVRKQLASFITQVAVSTIKTGMGGATGNKGGVGISFVLYNTSVCFVCSHFAAGQTQVMERNSDYDEISTKLSFLKARPLSYHDYVFWCGDFNYRIDMSGDEVKELVKVETWEKLRANDQLLEQKKMGNVFKGYNEGQINFAPTYKYDLFSDDYDTSEKCRVPAWTDRVLWKRRKWLSEKEKDQSCPLEESGKLISYTRTELRTSDHRPVKAVLDIPVSYVRDDARQLIYDELTASLQPVFSPVYVYVEGKPFIDLCQSFVKSLKIATPTMTRSFPSSLLVVYPEAWMIDEALKHDGEYFQGKRMRISVTNSNEDNIQSDSITSVENQSPEDLEVTSYSAQGGLTMSHSSGTLTNFCKHSKERPNSTPLFSNSTTTGQPPFASSISKKPPPRPPAISSVAPPPRPPAITSSLKPGAPKLNFVEEENESSLSPPSKPPSRPPPITKQFSQEAVDLNNSAEYKNPTTLSTLSSDSISNGQCSSTQQSLDFPDLSNWRIASEPPKIKPRKTVPKRRAPQAPTPSQRKTNFESFQITGSLLDDAFSNKPATSMPPPLVPTQSPANGAANNPSHPLLSIFDPFAPDSSKSSSLFSNTSPPKSNRAINRKAPPPPFSQSNDFSNIFDSNPSDDPWGSSFTASHKGKLNNSFTSDFNELNLS